MVNTVRAFSHIGFALGQRAPAPSRRLASRLQVLRQNRLTA